MMRDPSLLSPAGLKMLSSPLLVLLLATLVGFSEAAVPMQQLGMRSSDISWRTCSSGFKDDSFPSVCSSQDPSPYVVGVTISAVFSNVTSGGGGYARLSGDMATVLVIRGISQAYAPKIGWVTHGSDQGAEIGYSWIDGDDAAYPFVVENPSSWDQDRTVRARFSFEVTFPSQDADHSVYFEGCCRYSNLQNPGATLSVPWHMTSTVPMRPWSNPATPRASPIARMPAVDLLRRGDSSSYAFVLNGHGPSAVMSLLNTTVAVSGRYVRVLGANYHLDGGLVVRAGGHHGAYLREDGMFSVVWYSAPDNLPQFQSSRAVAYGPTWVLIRGDVSTRVGMQPYAPSAGEALAQGIGGVWEDGSGGEYPWHSPGALELAWTGTKLVIGYDTSFTIQAMPPPTVLGPGMQGPMLGFSLCGPSQMGGMNSRVTGRGIGNVLGATIDPELGVVVFPPNVAVGAHDLCALVTSGGVTIQVEVTVMVNDSSTMPGGYPSEVYGAGNTPFTTNSLPLEVDCGSSLEVPVKFADAITRAPLPSAARPTSLAKRGATFSGGMLTLSPTCGDREGAGLGMACFDAWSQGRRSYPRGCIQYRVNDATLSPYTPPPAPPTTPPPAPPPVTTTPMASPGITPPPQFVYESTDATSDKGYIDILYDSDLGMIPDEAYRAKFGSETLCAGARGDGGEGGIQRNVTDAWNAEQNGQDSPTRGMYYGLGPELAGSVQVSGGKEYKWTCVIPRRYWIRLARIEELQAAPGNPCLHCWSQNGA